MEATAKINISEAKRTPKSASADEQKPRTAKSQATSPFMCHCSAVDTGQMELCPVHDFQKRLAEARH